MIRRLFILFALFFLTQTVLQAQPSIIPGVQEGELLSPGRFSTTLTLLLSMAAITFVPFFLVSTTSFLRIIIVLSLMRQALGTQQSPPNMILIALAMFMTVFIMTPTWKEVNDTALEPYQAGVISQREAMELAVKPFKRFMLRFTRDKDLALFLEFSQVARPTQYEDIPIFVVIPSFIISELKSAFQIGFLLFIPFVVIDLIVSNILLSLGMFMLSPALISLPFKILLFILTDGWNLLVQGILLSFRVV